MEGSEDDLPFPLLADVFVGRLVSVLVLGDAERVGDRAGDISK